MVKGRVKWFLPFYLLTFLPFTASGQRLLTLDSCRAMALRSNKQMGVAKVKQEVAANLRRSARTKYLPHVSALGTYQFTSREISLLSDDQKSRLNNLGTTTVDGLQQGLQTVTSHLPMQQVGAVLGQLGISLESLHQMSAGSMQQFAAQLNGIGGSLVPCTPTRVTSLRAQ